MTPRYQFFSNLSDKVEGLRFPASRNGKIQTPSIHVVHALHAMSTVPAVHAMHALYGASGCKYKSSDCKGGTIIGTQDIPRITK